MSRSRFAFTLVELLVVIIIIAILVGLLIPAVNILREQGRQTTCMNNQRQLGQAILTYETNKRKLPGVMDMLTATDGKTFPYSWVAAIFPNVERNDLWNQLQDSTTAATVGNFRVAVTVCPDDPFYSDKNLKSLLSYGVDDQFFVDYRPTYFNPPQQPWDRNGKVVAPAEVSNLKTRSNVPNASFPRGQTVATTQIVMLGEHALPTPRSWADMNWDALAFPWPASPPVNVCPTVLASGHTKGGGGVIVVTYFDGHSAIIPADTQFPYSPYP